MSFKFFTNSEIDKQEWDNALGRCTNRMIYALSWWLDIVSPGWCAVWDKEKDLLFPLPTRRKFGFTYAYQPAFTQQLGLFAPTEKVAVSRELLDAIPYRFFELNLNEVNSLESVGDVHSVERKNSVLDLSSDYNSLHRNYSNGHRRNLARSEGLELDSHLNGRQLIRLFKENRGQETDLGNKEYELLLDLLDECKKRNLLHLTGVKSDGKLLAGAALVRSWNRLIFLFSGQEKEGMQKRAMFYLIDQAIRINAGNEMVFDFEGSNNPGLLRFYLGFGSTELVYLQLKRNRLPWPVRLIKK